MRLSKRLDCTRRQMLWKSGAERVRNYTVVVRMLEDQSDAVWVVLVRKPVCILAVG